MPATYQVLNPFGNEGIINAISDFAFMLTGDYGNNSSTAYLVNLSNPDFRFYVAGTGLTFNVIGTPISGTVSYFALYQSNTNTEINRYTFDQPVDVTIIEQLRQNFLASGSDMGVLIPFFQVPAILGGSAFDDTIVGNFGGLDQMFGQNGSDTYYVTEISDEIFENTSGPEGGDDHVIFSGTSGTFVLSANVEHLSLEGNYAINGTGNELANTITGNGAANTLSGLGGADTLVGGGVLGGGGVDTLIGGDGNDTYYVQGDGVVQETNAVLATGGDDLVYFTGFGGTFTLTDHVERLTLQGINAINGTGNNLANTLTGNSAANTLSGLGGVDKINGGLGRDTMIGGDGNDYYYVNQFDEIIIETNAVLATGGNDLVYFSGNSGTMTLSANVERLTLTGTSAINGTGNVLANTLTGNNAANRLTGLGGNDIINGGLGRDTMVGGAGSDTYFADQFNDIVVETLILPTTGGVDLVNFSGVEGTFVLSANVENLNLTGVEDIGGTGNSSRNSIVGNAGSNEIRGKEGNDSLTGGAGVDAFFFDTALDDATNVDTITDFNVTDDTILLDNAIFTALGLATDILVAAMFKNISLAGAVVDTTDRIIYDGNTGAISYDSDGSGSAAAIQFAKLTTAPTLSFEDFFVY